MSRVWKETVWRMLALVLAAAVAAVVHGIWAGIGLSQLVNMEGSVTVEEALQWQPVQWVDARSEAAYRRGHRPGAIHLDFDRWDEGLAALLNEWDPDVPVVIYCDGAGCDSSRAIATRLREELGIEGVFWLAGGWEVLGAGEDRP